MSNQRSRSALVKAKLILNTDDSRTAGDPFKFPAAFRGEFTVALEALDAADLKVGSQRGDGASASPKVRTAKTELGKLLREGYRALQGVPSYQLAAEDKMEIFEIYGWRSGEIGQLDDARIQEMADDVLEIAEQDPAPAWTYPAPLVALIATQIEIIDAQEGDAKGGEEQTAVSQRNTRLAIMKRFILRARFYYCFASDEVDRTPELARIAFQPRRPPTRPKEDSEEGTPSTTPIP